MVAAVAQASAGQKVAADFTVSEVFTGSPGVLQASIDGVCSADAQVSTEGNAVFTRNVGVFTGIKTFDCGSGNTFMLKYQANTGFGSPTDSGTWQIVGATGDLNGLKGNGKLVGTFTASGVDDHYTGTFTLPT